MRTGIALGRPLVPRMGQMFQWPGGGVPPLQPLQAQQAGIPYWGGGAQEPPTIHVEAFRYGTGRACDQTSPLTETEKLLIRSKAKCELSVAEAQLLLEEIKLREGMLPGSLPGFAEWVHPPFTSPLTIPRLQGLGLGSKNSLGADGVPLLARSIVSIPLQAAATWVGFHTGSEETGWLSAAGYVVGIVGAIGTLVSLLGLVVGTAAEVA